MMPEIKRETITFLVKTVLPAIAFAGITVAYNMREQKMSKFTAIISFCAGVAIPLILHQPVAYYISEMWQVGATAVLAMSGEKICRFFIFKFDIEKYIQNKIDNWLNNKK